VGKKISNLLFCAGNWLSVGGYCFIFAESLNKGLIKQ